MTQLQQYQQEITDAETALAALGPLSAANFDQALKLLRKRKNALDGITQVQQNQFFQNAFDLINQVQNAAQADKAVVASQYLRQFAEYVATQTQTLEKTFTTVKTIVDNIPPMPSVN